MRDSANFFEFPPVLVSYFPGYGVALPTCSISLFDFLTEKQKGFKDQVEKIRLTIDNEQRRKLKSQLPAITPAGEFSQRCKAGLLSFSGFVCVDIDGKDNPYITDFDALKRQLTGFPGLAYAGLSVGGNGLYLLIRVSLPDRYINHLNAIFDDLEGMGIKPDRVCVDISRLRGISYDPDPVLNPYVSAYTDFVELKHSYNTAQNITGDTFSRVSDIVNTIVGSHINISESYFDWFRIGQSLAAEFGEAGRGLFHTISAQSGKYNEQECDKQYTKCLGACNRVTIASFFQLCKMYGINIKRCKV